MTEKVPNEKDLYKGTKYASTSFTRDRADIITKLLLYSKLIGVYVLDLVRRTTIGGDPNDKSECMMKFSLMSTCLDPDGGDVID